MARLNAKRMQDENSFLAIPKDFKKITERIMDNDKLLKLIYYNTKDALDQPNLTLEQKLGLVNENILSYPYIPTSDDTKTYVQVLFDNFSPNATNPQYVDNFIVITVLCNKQNWILENWNLRLYAIANEIMNIISDKKLTGIGTAQFFGATAFVPDKDNFGLTMTFSVINSINTKEEE